MPLSATLAAQLQALETVPDSYLILSPELLILTASNAYLAATLTRREQLVGRYVFDAFPDNPAAPEAHAVRNLHASLKTVLATGQPHQMALQHYDVPDPDHAGQFVQRHWQPRNTPVFAEPGVLAYLIHSVVNVTERVVAEQALEQSQHREQAARAETERQRAHLEQVFAQAPVAIAVFRGLQYVIEAANPTMCRLWGRTPQQALGTPLFDLLPEAAGQGFEQLLEEVRTTGVPYVAHELPSAIDRDGRRDLVHWNFVYHPLREDDQLTGVIVVATEVSEQVAARQQLLQVNEQLRRTNVDLDNFIYTASHDLKAPITNLEGLLHLLRAELPAAQLTGTIAEALELMQGAIDRFQRTIAHLAEVTHLSQEAALPTARVALAEVVEDVRLDLAAQVQQTAAQLTVDVQACPTIAFSAKNLRSVVYNLLSNALKYRHPDRPPHITLGCHAEADFLVLTVQDNGLGLDASAKQSLFQRFQRFHPQVAGSGIGLYMVKKIVENAGGYITVQSEVDQGTTFAVHFKQ